MKREKFDIIGMSCAACQARVQKAVESVDGVSSVNVNLLKNSMTVDFDDGSSSVSDIENAVQKAGYKAISASKKSADGQAEKSNRTANGEYSLKEIIIGGILLLLIVYISMGNMSWGFPLPDIFDHRACPIGNALLQFILLLPLLFIFRRYFVSGFKKLFKGSPNMDSLIAVGATVSVVYSVFVLFAIAVITNASDTEKLATFSHSLYFESAAMILTLVSLGKYLEGLSKKKTTDAVTKLIDLAPKTATVLRDGKEIIIAAQNVKIGDIVIVKKGALVPVDGVIEDGSASFDQSNITGESMPVFKKSGEEVFASTLLTAGFVTVRVTKEYQDTSYAKIVKVVEEATNSKAPISKLADKISGVFVPIILITAALTFIVNLLVGVYALDLITEQAFDTAIRFAVTVVVIACPCALGLATPVAIMVGSGKGAENGLIIKNAEILENTHRIKIVVLDKTGTLTEGKPQVTDLIPLIGGGEEITSEILSAVYSIETMSEHPLSLAIAEYAKGKNAAKKEVADYEFSEGTGVTGKIDGDEYFIGNFRHFANISDDSDIIKISQKLAADGKTPLAIAKNGKIVFILAVKDKVRADSAQAIAELKRKGIKIIMLTGDNRITAQAVAKEVGVDRVFSEVLPEDKRRIITELKKETDGLIAMVGDGVNDAPALTAADIGVAIGGGSDATVESGDIVLLRNSLFDLVNAIALGKRTLNTIKLSLFWAFFYNFICVFLATGALYYTPLKLGLKPEYGAIAMSLSSVSVVLTALSINFFRPKKPSAVFAETKIDNADNTDNTDTPQNKTVTVTLTVSGMHCKICERKVETAVKEIDGVITATAFNEENQVIITATDKADIKAIKDKIIGAGFTVES